MLRFLAFCCFTLCLSVCQAQKLNLETQTKSAPGTNHVGLSNGNGNSFQWVPVANLNTLLTDEVIQGAGAPSSGPTSNQGNVYINTSNGAVYTWNGSIWVLQGISSLTANNGLTKTAQNVKLGGNLVEATTVRGTNGTYSMTLDSLLFGRIWARSNSGTAQSILLLTSAMSTGATMQSNSTAFPAVYSRSWITPFQNLMHTDSTTTRGFVRTGTQHAEMAYATLTGEVATPVRRVVVSDQGTYATGLPAADGSYTEMLYINPATGALAKGAAPSGGGSLVQANPATGVYVVYSGTGVTATRSSGSVTITVPNTAKLISARVTGADADNDGSGNLSVTFSGAGLQGNTSTATLHVPATQKIDLSAQVFGAPATSNPFNVDDDDTVQMQVVGVGSAGSPSITMRAVGLTANYNNYQLAFDF